MIEPQHIEASSRELLALLGTSRQIAPFSRRHADFDLRSAYAVVNRVRDLRMGRGETPIGRKIGFTNASTWQSRGLSAPIWNYVYDSTVAEAVAGSCSVDTRAMPEARIEPEVVLHLSKPPAPGMSLDELGHSLDWIAPAFEVVFSIFPEWDFTPADAAAAYGVHGALFLGEPIDVTRHRSARLAELAEFTVELSDAGGQTRRGSATDVLGGPLRALAFLVKELAERPDCDDVRAGEIVTTGTLTEAMPLVRGHTWRATFDGIAFEPIQLTVG